MQWKPTKRGVQLWALGIFYGEISKITKDEDENRIGREYALSIKYPYREINS
jgi:hypothetical protein